MKIVPATFSFRIVNESHTPLVLAGYNRGAAAAPMFAEGLAPGESRSWSHTYTNVPDNDGNGFGCHVRYGAYVGDTRGSAGLAWSGRLVETPDPEVVILSFEVTALADQDLSGTLRWVGNVATVTLQKVATHVWVPIPPNIRTVVKLARAVTKRKRILAIARDEINWWDKKRQEQPTIEGPITQTSEVRERRAQYFDYMTNTPHHQQLCRQGINGTDWCGIFAWWCVRHAGVPGVVAWDAGPDDEAVKPQLATSGARPLKLFNVPHVARARVKPGDILAGLNDKNHIALVDEDPKNPGAVGGKLAGNAGGGPAAISYALRQGPPERFGYLYCTVPSPLCIKEADRRAAASGDNPRACPAAKTPNWPCPPLHGPSDWNK